MIAVERRIHRRGAGLLDALGQRRRNAAAIAAERRAATRCKFGHEFTPENTYVRLNGHRQCRTCNRDRRWFSEHGIGWQR